MRRVFFTAMMVSWAIIATNAQTADNLPTSIGWQMGNGTITEAPDFTPEVARQFILKTEIVKGTGLNNPVAKTSDVESITQTMFPVTSKTSSASDANTVSFLVTLQEGISFTPTTVSFKAFRWKTDKGNFDAAWLCDNAKTTLVTGERPNRGAGSGASTVSSYSYDLSGSAASEKQFGLSVSKGNTNITASYVSEQSLLVNDYIVVSNIDELRAAIKQLNQENSSLRRFIFLKNGDYDYGTYKNPESGADPYGRDTIKVDNISLIGQSTAGVNVHIQPTMASVSRTAPIVLSGTGTYLQDFTLQNNYAYGGNDGQAAALMDKGHHTIGKNMSLISRQDTYYSNTDNGQLYFEDTHFEGTVDYIC